MATTTKINCDLCKNEISWRGFPTVNIKDVHFADMSARVTRLEFEVSSIEGIESGLDICNDCVINALRRHFKLKDI